MVPGIDNTCSYMFSWAKSAPSSPYVVILTYVSAQSPLQRAGVSSVDILETRQSYQY